MSEISDAQIDADLTMDGFDPTESYPEYGHEALRTAYRSGVEAGRAAYAAELRDAGQVIVPASALAKLGGRHEGAYQDPAGFGWKCNDDCPTCTAKRLLKDFTEASRV